MAAWRKEEIDARRDVARRREGQRDMVKLSSHTEA